jgi:hypothetical protein
LNFALRHLQTFSHAPEAGKAMLVAPDNPRLSA